VSATEEFTEFAIGAAPRLRRTAFLLCGDWHTAEDLTQTTLARMFVSWRRISRQDAAYGYANGTLVNAFLAGTPVMVPVGPLAMVIVAGTRGAAGAAAGAADVLAAGAGAPGLRGGRGVLPGSRPVGYAVTAAPCRGGCCGRSSMAELQPSKLVMRVRFPSPAPLELPPS
jgi:hypothetical protein